MDAFTYLFIYGLIALARIPMSGTGESTHSCPVPNLRGKAFSLSPVRSRLSIDALYQVEEAPFCNQTAESFYQQWILDFVKFMLFFVSVEILYLLWVLSFIPLIWYVTWLDFGILNQLCSHSWDESHFVMVYNMWFLFHWFPSNLYFLSCARLKFSWLFFF